MKIAFLQNNKHLYSRIEHLISTLRLKNDVFEINNIDELDIINPDILILEYYVHISNDKILKAISDRISSVKDKVLKFKGKVILYSTDDGQFIFGEHLDIEIANRIDCWLVFVIMENYISANLEIYNIIKHKFVLIPRIPLNYTKTDDVVYDTKINKIVFVGHVTGTYNLNGKNCRMECLDKIWNNSFLKENFDGWVVNDYALDVINQNVEYDKTFKFVRKNKYLLPDEWLHKLKTHTLSLCPPGHTNLGYRHYLSMACKTTMVANFNLELDPYPWLFSDKLKDISYTVKEDLSNFDEVCCEALTNREKSKEYAMKAYDVYKTYFELTPENTYQTHVWDIVRNNMRRVDVYLE